MAKGKRAKSDTTARVSSAKLAIKKKRKNDARGTKYKNAELKATLDGQTQIIYEMATSTMPATETRLDVGTEVHDLANVLGSL